jgi:predicted RNA-binding Zn-ribbon protein involved in translation (DUF1610 family)
MFDRLRLLVQRVVSGTEEAFCLSCQAKRTIVRSRRVKIHTPKGISTRLIGRCLTCRRQTSSFVRAA